jgi:hypothetical protein
MITDKIFKKIERVIQKDQLRSLEDIIVYQDENGIYQLFETYSIEKVDSLYVVSGNKMTKNLSFSILKNAVTWCTYDKRNRIIDAKTIFELDQQLSRIDSDIIIRQSMIHRTTIADEKLIYIAKLGEDKIRRKQMVKQLDDYIQESKNWQIKRLSKN